MRISKLLLLIRQVECNHNWSFSDGMAPRWCRICNIKLGGRQDHKIQKIKLFLGKNE